MRFVSRVIRDLRHPGRVLFALVLVGLIALCVYGLWHRWQVDRHLQVADEALTRNDLEQAKAHLLLYLKAHPSSPDAHFRLARIARRASAYEEAGQYLRECERLGGIPEAIELERLLQRVQRGDIRSGESVLWAYVRMDHPDSNLILEALARGYVDSFRLFEALDCLDAWLQRQPDSVQALFWRGKVREHRKDIAGALADYRRAVELDPGHDLARLHLADLLVRKLEPAAALEHYQHLFCKLPESPPVLLGLARAQVALGRLEVAEQTLDRLLALSPRDVNGLVTKGKLEMSKGRPAAGEPWLRKATDLAPYDREAVYNLGQCLSQLGQKQAAAKWKERLKEVEADLARLNKLTQAIIQSPGDAAARCAAGKIFLKVGQDVEGLRWLQSALQEDPGHEATHQAFAEYYRRTGRPDLAARHEQAVGKTRKDNP
jgi:tetratricopeptide (TPR) repeat protein